MLTNTSKTEPLIVAGIPAYNEEKYIGTIVLKTRQYVSEVIVIDDGSTDKTAKVAELAGASVIKHAQNKGKGAGIQLIITEARVRKADILVLLDGDGQHNPDEIPNLIKPVLDGYDLVIGSRERQRLKVPGFRRVGQRVLSRLSRRLSGKKIADSESGFRALSTRAISRLNLEQSGFAIETEMISASADANLKIIEVPISAIYSGDSSTLNPVAHGLGNFTWILVLISERRPLVFFGIAGIISLIIGVLLGWSVVSKVAESGVVPVGTTFMSVLFIIISIFAFFTGIILNTIIRMKSK